MATLLFTIAVFGLFFIAMSAGILMGRKPIQGSCGGLNNKCSSCTRPCKKNRGEEHNNDAIDRS